MTAAAELAKNAKECLARAGASIDAPNILLIPGTSSVGHLRENLKAAEIALDGDALAELETVAGADAH